MKIIGLISGTSTDGVDVALVDISGRGIRSEVKLQAFETYAYSKDLKKRLVLAASGDADAEDICHLNSYVGEVFAQAAMKLAKKNSVDMDDVALIGSHGQTIAHLPKVVREGGFKITSTLQVGEPAVIAERTGVTTIADFRPHDMAAGGQGAPLTPYLHYILFHDANKSRLVVNMGGISNMTY